MAYSKFSLFGIKFGKKDEEPLNVSFTEPENDDGATTIAGSGFISSTLDLDGICKNEVELITKYREMSLQPEIMDAIDDIINESIAFDDDGTNIKLVLDNLEVNDKIKTAILEEFDILLKLLNYNNMATDIFKRFYVDGRLPYHVILDKDDIKKGIVELRYIDPRKIKKVREVKKSKDNETGVEFVTNIEEYYVYNDKNTSTNNNLISQVSLSGIKIAPQSIVYITSGLMDAKKNVVLSYLHNCISGNERIRTTTGWKFVNDINTGDVIYSYDMEKNSFVETNVVDRWKTGNKQLLKIKSRHTELLCTDNHPILIKDSATNKIKYINAGDLIPKQHKIKLFNCDLNGEKIKFPDSDRILVSKVSNPEQWIEYEMKGKKAFIFDIAKKYNQNKHKVYSFIYGNQPLETSLAKQIINEFPISLELNERYEGVWKNDINIPEYVDEDFAKLFGFLIGDGWVNTHSIGFAEGIDKDQNEYYANLMKKYFGNCNRIDAPSKKCQYKSWFSQNTLGCELLKKMGFISGAKNKRIPDWVFKSNRSIKLAFIEGLHDADGCDRTKNENQNWSSTINLCNKLLILDIKELWTSVGFCSGKISHYKTKAGYIATNKYPTPEKDVWSIFLSKKPLNDWENVLSVEYLPETQDVFDIEVDSEFHNFIANGIVIHNCIRPLNQLRMIEDAALINKITRSPIRRIFYVDVGTLPKQKAESYMREMMQKYRNKLVYNYTTGEIANKHNHLSMLEDYWIPLRADARSTKIETLEGADSFQNMDMINYFEQKLYKSLKVPVGRLNSDQQFSMGRSNEITRDELKFAKFIEKLRNKFTELFDQLLEIQLVLKGICTTEEWNEFKENIFYNFVKDNNFTELKEAELIQNRLGMLSLIDPFCGRYYSRHWIQQNVLRLNDEEIKKLEKEMDEEAMVDIQKDAEKMAAQMQVQQQLGMDGQVDQQNGQAEQGKPQMSSKNPYNV